jgi:TonB family protein
MIQATLLLACAWCAATAMSRRSPAERHVLWAAALGAAALLPPMSMLLGLWQPTWTRSVAGIFPAIIRTALPDASTAGADIVIHASALEDAASTVFRAAAIVWIVGTSVALVTLFAGALRLSRFATLARPITDDGWHRLAADVSRQVDIHRPVCLLQATAAQMPMTWGIRRPRVVLPLDAEHWADDRRRAVLAHELAHVRRDDWLVQIAAAVACAVYWFNPLFWLAYRRLRDESEHACDDVVVSIGVDARDYAGHLFDIVQTARVDDRRWRSALAMARPSQLERRFAALLLAARSRRPVSGRSVAAVVAVAAASVVPLAAMSLSPIFDATIRVEKASLPPAIDIVPASSDIQAMSAIRRVRTVDVFSAAKLTTAPDVLEYTTPPLYSDEARRRRIEGIVTIQARVGVDGRIAAPRVISGLGFGLDQNALVALRQWQFRAGTQGGIPVEMTAAIDIEFNLRNEALNELIANDMATRIGPDVTAPRIIRRVNVSSARDADGERPSGTVVLDVVLMEDGRPKIVRVLRSLTPPLDERAIDAFEQWRFSPALKAGRPVKVRLQADVTFR